MERLLERALQLENLFVSLRREFHAEPELAHCEQKTAARIERELRSFGIEVFRHKTCVLGVLHGAQAGKTVVLRADIDALPVEEKTSLSFSSKAAGVCHACGHDIHTTALLFAAKLLSERRESLKGTLKFLFQPAEEALSGAQLVLNETDFLDDADAIFAAHTWPDLPVGSVGVRFGPMMAAADTFEIKVLAQGGHAAHPQRTADPVLAAAQIITQLHTIVSREIAPTESGVLTVGEVHAGSAPNIIPAEAVLRGTVRSLTEETRQKIRASVERIALSTAESLRAKAEVNYFVGCPPLCGETALVSLVKNSAQSLLGKENVRLLEAPSLGSEDFAYYLQRIPGAFFRIGTHNDLPESHLGLHNPKIVFDEKAVCTAAVTLSSVALSFTQAE